MKVRDAVRGLGIYHPPLEARKDAETLMLDFNESTIPPAPEVTEALVRFVRDGKLERYPHYGEFEAQVATYAGVPPEQLILANGSDQALDITMRAILEPGDEIIMAAPGFAMIPQFAGVQGARVVSPTYRPDMSYPMEEVLAAVTPATRVIAIINPNNPTGTLLPVARIAEVLRALPNVAILVDEAYFEFTGITAKGLIGEFPNLAITRTFSKAFALAGLRLGYVLSNPDFVRELYKVRGPYDVNAMALRAAAAWMDHPAGWHAYVSEVMEQAKPMVERFFDEHGVDYVKGAANFMLVRPGDPHAAFEFLRDRKILVRPQGPPIADTFRLSVGTVADMRRFMEVYADFLAGDQPARAAN